MNQELVRFEVPRVTVDFEGDELTGRQKLTVLKYLSLDDAIEQLGVQRFGRTTVENIALQPVREWVSENWDEDFVYDLSRRNIPISFRASLAVGLFTTKITEYLADLGTVEVYASRDIQEVFRKHELPVPQGLTEIDYASLPADVKRELAIPIVENLYKAEAVAQANLLFPNGVNKQAITLSDLSLIFGLVDAERESDLIYFDRIRNLDIQATAARACINDYIRIKSLEGVVQETEGIREEDPAEFEKMIEKFEKEMYGGCTEIFKVPKVEYEEGTTIFDVFPSREGENHEDLRRAFERIATYGTTYRMTCEGERGDYVELTIDRDGNLMGEYIFTDYGTPTKDKPLSFNALTEEAWPGHPGNIHDEFRCKAVHDLMMDLRDEMDTTREAIQQARAKYNGTSFTVEQGFLEAITFRKFKEASKAELEEDKRLAKEARETVGIYDGLSDAQSASTTDLVVYSEKPVDDRILELDYHILRAIIESYHDIGLSDMFAVIGGRFHKDNVGDWFSSVSSLLSKFKSVLLDPSEAFSVLGIPPTNNPDEVKKAYRVISVRNHPDKTSHLPPEEQLAATERFMEAAVAYKTVMSRIESHDVNALSPVYYLGRISQLFSQ